MNGSAALYSPLTRRINRREPMQLTPEQGLFLLQIALPTLKNEQQTTKRVIEAMPKDKGDYRPEPNAKSALELAWHIAPVQNSFLSSIAAGAFDFSAGARPDSGRDSMDIAAWYHQSFAKNLAALSAMTGEQL